jgi:DNA-binding NarL/FixJ family response regulator
MGDTDRTATRVVVVDDDDVNRAGLTALLGAHPDIRVTAALDHHHALADTACWHTADVALVDAADPRNTDDQFPGVAVVRHIRAITGRKPAVVVVTGHFFNDAVRRRMREAQADYYYHRSELAYGSALHDAILQPMRTLPPPQDPEAQFRHGVTQYTRVNEAVRYALDRQLPQRLTEHSSPRARAWEKLRREFNHQARLAVITTDGREPDRNQDTPSLRQISRFLNWATQIDPRRQTDRSS